MLCLFQISFFFLVCSVMEKCCVWRYWVGGEMLEVSLHFWAELSLHCPRTKAWSTDCVTLNPHSLQESNNIWLPAFPTISEWFSANVLKQQGGTVAVVMKWSPAGQKSSCQLPLRADFRVVLCPLRKSHQHYLITQQITLWNQFQGYKWQHFDSV